MDLIDRQVAINALKEKAFSYSFEVGYNKMKVQIIDIINAEKAYETIESLPSAQPELSFVTWLLDEIWDEDMWELNWQAFPEVLCRKLTKLGYIKEKDGEYERLDK